MDFRAYIEITRPINTFVAAIAIALAAMMTKEMNYGKLAYAIISAGLVSSGGNVINDYYDYKIDLINKPKRPLPSGRISLSNAFRYSMILFVLGGSVSLLINAYCAIIAISICFVLVLYAKILKNAGFLGNITIAIMTALAIIYGGLAVSTIEKIVFVALFAFLINFGREIIKDAEDYEGDKAGGAKTLAIKYGIRRALAIATIPLLAVMGVTPIPYILEMYNNYYMAIMIIGIDLPLVYSIYLLNRVPTTDTAAKIQKLLKILIIIGIIGLYLGL